MKSPVSEKEMPLQASLSKQNFRKEDFDYVHLSFYCEESGEYFTTTDLDDFNENQVCNHYRAKYSIPFVEELILFRKTYGLSASKMSKILGLGINGYRNYEQGEIPSLSNSNLIRTVMNNPCGFRSLVEECSTISSKEKSKLLNKIQSVEEQQQNGSRQTILKFLIPDRKPTTVTGFRKPNSDKLFHMILFFSQRMAPSITRMNKLLFYTDFNHFKQTGFSISGSVYRALEQGPALDNFRSIYEYLETENCIEISYEEFEIGVMVPRIQPGTSLKFNGDLFDEKELLHMELIAEKFKGFTATQLKDFSHLEKAWVECIENRSIIDYCYALSLNLN